MPILSPISAPRACGRAWLLWPGVAKEGGGGTKRREQRRKRRTRKEGWQSPRESSTRTGGDEKPGNLGATEFSRAKPPAATEEIYTRCWGRWQASERADQHTLEKRTRALPCVCVCVCVCECARGLHVYPDHERRRSSCPRNACTLSSLVWRASADLSPLWDPRAFLLDPMAEGGSGWTGLWNFTVGTCTRKYAREFLTSEG